MGYKVVTAFRDSSDNLKEYAVGDEYPKGDYKPTQKRISELSEKHPVYKRIFIKEVESAKPPNQEEPKKVKKSSAKKPKTKEK